MCSLIVTLRDENLKVEGVRGNPNTKRKRRDRFKEVGGGMDWTNGRKQDFVGKGLHQYLRKRRSRKDLRNLDKDDIYRKDKFVSWQ